MNYLLIKKKSLQYLTILVICYLLFFTVKYFFFNHENQNQQIKYSNLNYYSEVEPRNLDNSINIVIEIPSGTNEKWEVSKNDGSIKLEFKKNKPRIIKYIEYPVNYGMIPRTIFSKDMGGDGDPVDVILIGPSIKRGEIVNGKIIGLMKMIDEGEKDDKVLAVSEDSYLFKISDVEELRENYPGVLEIINIWFENYKGQNKIEILGFESPKEANKLIDISIKNFKLIYNN